MSDKKPVTLEEALAAVKNIENELLEKIQWVNDCDDSQLVELLGLAKFDNESTFNERRFTDAVILKSLRRILIKLDEKAAVDNPPPLA